MIARIYSPCASLSDFITVLGPEPIRLSAYPASCSEAIAESASGTAEAISTDPEWQDRVRISWRLFSTGGSFEVGDLLVESFSVPHDAYDPVGYVIRRIRGTSSRT